jgi:Leucine-rich repeat (LRR) protein
LDLSKNALTTVNPQIANLKNLKSLNLEGNKLTPGSLIPVSHLPNLQSLSVGRNFLGKPTAESKDATVFPPKLPATLKQVKLNANFFSSVPKAILSVHLVKLEKLDLSQNHLAAIPMEIANLKNLNELNVDDNSIVSLPTAMGLLKKLKVLSLKGNQIRVYSMTWSETNPQPLPKNLFTDTPLIDLNLHGNPMTSTQLNSMEGFDEFLKRRQQMKTTALVGGAMINLDVCGLE